MDRVRVWVMDRVVMDRVRVWHTSPQNQTSKLAGDETRFRQGTRPAQIWPYACVPDPNRSEPSREGRALVCNRAVERRFRAISADWRF